MSLDGRPLFLYLARLNLLILNIMARQIGVIKVKGALEGLNFYKTSFRFKKAQNTNLSKRPKKNVKYYISYISSINSVFGRNN